MNAKLISWLAKGISVCFMILSFFFTDKTASDICLVGLTIMAVVGTIDISIWIDKIIGAKKDYATTEAVGTDVPHDADAETEKDDDIPEMGFKR